MENIIAKFEKFGFNKAEVLVYLDLLKNPNATGYQVFKNTELAKPSVYDALDNLYRKGAVFLIQGNSKIYAPKDPEVLFEELEADLLKTSSSLKEDLAEYSQQQCDNLFWNLEGDQNLVHKVKEFIISAEKEIYLNSNYNLKEFHEELKKASSKGVRIVIFTFDKIEELEGVNIEVYYNDIFGEEYTKNLRMMLVIDCNKALIARETFDSFNGVFSCDPFFSEIISEHIHNDIYLLRIREQYNVNFDNVVLNSLKERMFSKLFEKK